MAGWVTTCARSRFYIFEQAFELQKHGLLDILVTDYPKSFPMRYGIKDENVSAKIMLGLLAHGIPRLESRLKLSRRDYLHEFISNYAGRTFASSIGKNSNVVIAMSSFALEGIHKSKKLGIKSIVDHASLDLTAQIKFVEKEALVHGMNINDVHSTIPEWVIKKERREFNEADHVFCVSQLAKDTLVSNGVSEDKIFINHLGVDLKRFRNVKRNKRKSIKLGFVGQVTLAKGILTLLSSMALLNDKNIELLIVGQRYPNKYLDEKIDLLTAGNVRFLGVLDQKDLEKFYNEIDIFVMPSAADGFGLVVTQALACGVPVIVSNQCGSSEVVNAGHSGEIFKSGDPVDLSNNITKIISDLDSYIVNASRWRRESEDKFTWQAYGNRLVKFLKQNCKP